MNIRPVLRGFAVILLIYSLFFFVTVFVALCFGERFTPFLVPGVSVFVFSLAILLLIPKTEEKISHKQSFVLVTGTWFLICFIGSFPFLLDDTALAFADAFFESTSGFTTTGSSIFSDVELLPKSILFWRSLTHWIGGMGIIVLTVAVLPLLGVSGYQLMKAEAPGPDIEKLTPRITHTAKVFWIFYISLTVIETILLWAGGLSFFDALNHTFATLATGGFSTRNGSIAAFQNPYAEVVVTVFMVLSGINFTLYYRMVIKDLDRVRNDSEVKAYLGLFLFLVVVVTINLWSKGTFGSWGVSLRKGAFQVATLMTSTGFATADYTLWPELSQSVLLLMLFIGGCVGSTSGGIKMFHVTVLSQLVAHQIKRLIHPSGVFCIRLNRKPLSNDIIVATVGFVTLYISLVLLSTMVVASSGTDLITGFTASLAVIGNIGPGFGKVGPAGNFVFFPAYVKIWLSIVMVLGRLEIYTVLVIFTPAFLRR